MAIGEIQVRLSYASSNTTRRSVLQGDASETQAAAMPPGAITKIGRFVYACAALISCEDAAPQYLKTAHEYAR
jgi:hypothetical protein